MSGSHINDDHDFCDGDDHFDGGGGSDDGKVFMMMMGWYWVAFVTMMVMLMMGWYWA